MVGLGPSAQADIRRRAIHEFLGARPRGVGKVVDGRAKHDHDEGERLRGVPRAAIALQHRHPLHRHPGLEPGSISPRLVRLANGSRIMPLTRPSGMTFGVVDASVRKAAALANVSRETRKT
jgi:hypothetical protein